MAWEHPAKKKKKASMMNGPYKRVNCLDLAFRDFSSPFGHFFFERVFQGYTLRISGRKNLTGVQRTKVGLAVNPLCVQLGQPFSSC